MSRFIALVRKETLLLLRDVHGLLVLFAMPAAFILIMSLALRDGFDGQGAVSVDFLLSNQTSDTAGAQLAESLTKLPGFTAVPTEGGETEIRRRLANQDYRLAVLVPPDLSARLADWGKAEAPAPVQVLLAPGVSPQARLLFESALTSALQRQRLQALLPALGRSTAGEGAALTDARLSGEYVFREAAPRARPTAVQQSVPAWLVFGMFFVVIPLASAFLVERQQGSLVRLQLMDVRPAVLLASKILPYYCVNQAQMLMMLLVGMYLVPLLGGDALNPPLSWGGLWLISSATSLAAIGLALLIASLVRSGTAATTLGGGANIILAALGGVMVPKFVMPGFMQEITVVSPMSWGLEGFLDVFLRGGGWREVLTETGALLVFGGVCLTAAALFFHGRLRGPA